MKVIDLTHTIKEGMLVYPGTDGPVIREACTLEKDGFRETLLSIFSHVGTHIDAPYHLFQKGASLDSLAPSYFIGKALVIDCRALGDGESIGMAQLEPYREHLDKVDFLLFCTGYDRRFGDASYFGNFPCLDDEVLDFVLKGNYKGIGSDTMSMDPMSDAELVRHRRFLGAKTVINIENLKDLALCGNEPFLFACLPLKYANADGAPARAVAYLE